MNLNSLGGLEQVSCFLWRENIGNFYSFQSGTALAQKRRLSREGKDSCRWQNSNLLTKTYSLKQEIPHPRQAQPSIAKLQTIKYILWISTQPTLQTSHFRLQPRKRIMSLIWELKTERSKLGQILHQTKQPNLNSSVFQMPQPNKWQS